MDKFEIDNLVMMKSCHRSLSKIYSDAGFSIMELMVAIALISGLSGVMVMNVPTVLQSFKRLDVRQELIHDFKRAQSEAITWGCRGIFSIDGDGEGYSFGCDFLAYDENDPPVADSIFFTRSLPFGITISNSTLSPIIFNSRGQSVDIYNDMLQLTVTLSDSTMPSPEFASGTMLGTGVFSHE